MYGNGTVSYRVPRYRAREDESWYHVLYGSVPNHEIDFMYCPEVPQGPLTSTHFNHIARLIKYVEPQPGASHAFAIGNLSRDDVQHEPGHGAIGVLVGVRIGGAIDHAGRVNPPFAHGIIAVDKNLDEASLLTAATTFQRHFRDPGSGISPVGSFYRQYARAMMENRERVGHVLARHVEDFGDLPYLRRSNARWEWSAEDSARQKRVVLVHRHDEPFGSLARVAAKIAAVLYRSNLKWTSISTGREVDISGGVSVRLASERSVTAEDRQGLLAPIEEVPDDDAEIARTLFGLRPSEGERSGPHISLSLQSPMAEVRALIAKASASSVPPAPASSRDFGAERAAVMQREKLRAAWAPSEAPPPDSESAGAALAPPGQSYAVPAPSRALMESAGVPVPIKLPSVPPPPLSTPLPPPAEGRGADYERMIVQNRPPARRKTWIWAAAGLGAAGLAALLVTLVVFMRPGQATGPEANLAPGAANTGATALATASPLAATPNLPATAAVPVAAAVAVTATAPAAVPAAANAPATAAVPATANAPAPSPAAPESAVAAPTPKQEAAPPRPAVAVTPAPAERPKPRQVPATTRSAPSTGTGKKTSTPLPEGKPEF